MAWKVNMGGIISGRLELMNWINPTQSESLTPKKRAKLSSHRLEGWLDLLPFVSRGQPYVAAMYGQGEHHQESDQTQNNTPCKGSQSDSCDECSVEEG